MNFILKKYKINTINLINSLFEFYMKLNFKSYLITIFIYVIYVIFMTFSLLHIYFRYFLKYASSFFGVQYQ